MQPQLCHRIKLNRRPNYIGFEKAVFPNLTVSSYLWQRSFYSSQAAILSSNQGVFYLPDDIRSRYFDLGIELLLRDVFLVKKNSSEIYLVTKISPIKFTNRVTRLSYQINALVNLRTFILFKADLVIEDEAVNPKSSKVIQFFFDPRSWKRII